MPNLPDLPHKAPSSPQGHRAELVELLEDIAAKWTATQDAVAHIDQAESLQGKLSIAMSALNLNQSTLLCFYRLVGMLRDQIAEQIPPPKPPLP